VKELLLQPSSTSRHSSAESSDWTGTWVGVGFADDLTEEGAVLPATVGHHGVHVRRTGAGLVAAINARPFGGCMSVPVHCASTGNVRCPHLACAFSADAGILDNNSDPGGRARREFIGDGRRTVELPLRQWGSVLFLNLTLAAPGPLSVPAAPRGRTVATGSRPVPGSWLVAARREAAELGGLVCEVPPNVALVQRGTATVVVISRPAGPTRSTLLWAEVSDDVGQFTAGSLNVTALNGKETATEPR
jgi:nitrite reductase/ring-hydroxylating ferredoxin subunit